MIRALMLLAGGLLVATFAATAFAIPPEANKHRRDLTRAARSVWGLQAPIASLAAQIHAESFWRADAVSGAGARGIAQVMPATAEGLARQHPGLRPPREFDPRWSFLAQSTLMLEGWRRRAGARNACERYAFSAADYSQGPTWTSRQIGLAPDPRRYFGSAEHVNPGKSDAAFRETHEYVRRVLLRLTPLYLAWGPGHCASYG